jgi:hypothetical protein
MKIIKVLGSKRMYLMDDGSKRPFKSDIKKETVTIDDAIEVLEQKPKKKRKRRKKKEV